MKVLWICNVILPEFSDEFRIKKVRTAGWISGLLEKLDLERVYDIAFAFPVMDEERFHSGIVAGRRFYSFHSQMDSSEYDVRYRSEFDAIYRDFVPDVIHIWGTEFRHTRYALEVAESLNLLKKTVVHIQGLVGPISKHYMDGLKSDICEKSWGEYQSIQEEAENFGQRGVDEKVSLNLTERIFGRTGFDRAYTYLANPKVEYIHCGEIMRSGIICHQREWSWNMMCPHTIFISQAYYPCKGFHFLLSAMQYIKKIYPDTICYVAGPNMITVKDDSGRRSPYAKHITDLISRYDLSENIVFTGLLDEEGMVNQYRKANVFVTPSTDENSSNSICEALTIGVPTVSSFVGGIPSLVENGSSGFLVPVGYIEMLAYDILQLFENKELAEGFSKKGWEKISNITDPNKVVSVVVKTYKNLSKK